MISWYYLSLSDLLHSVWQSLGPSMLLQIASFHFFIWLSNNPLYIFTTSSLWTFRFFRVLAIINSVTMDFGVHWCIFGDIIYWYNTIHYINIIYWYNTIQYIGVFFLIMVFSGYISRSAIVGSYNSSIFSFLQT